MRFFALLLLLTSFSSSATAAFDSAEFNKTKELNILRITPEGEDAADGRQIVIQFNRPVVAVGEMGINAKEVPIAIEPQVECEWRWLNTSALSCNLGDNTALKIATTYNVTVNPGIKAEDGETIAKPYNHKFTTTRPNVSYVWFKKWTSPSMPILRVTFNQAVTKASVEASLKMLTNDIAPAQSFAIVASADPDDRELPSYLPIPGTNAAIITDAQKQKSDDEAQTVKGEEARRIWLVNPVEELPLDQSISLKVSPGLVSAVGPEKGNGDWEAVRFQTFPEFAFKGIKCYTNEDDANIILIEPNKPETQKLCNPMRGAALAFTSPVLRSQVKTHISFTPKINMSSDGSDPWGDGQDYSSLSQSHQKDKTYDIWLPAGLKAATEYHLQTKEVERSWFEQIWDWIVSLFVDIPATELVDEFNRPLADKLDITYKNNHRKPNYEIVHNDAVIEKQIDSEVPLYVNNLKTTTFNYRRVTTDGAKADLKSVQEIPQVQDIQFAIPFKLREMLEGKSGAVFGYLDTNPAVSKYGRENRLFAQVTPYQVHVKLGHFNSSVWVTDLATGLPVEGAKVTVYADKLTVLGEPKDVLTTVTTGADGLATFEGTEKFDPELDKYDGWEDQDTKIFVRVDKDGEMAVMPLNRRFEIDSYRSVGESVYYDNQQRYEHMQAWGTTAQGVYRVGDTIQYKLYVRNQDVRALTAAPAGTYRLEIFDPTDNKVHTIKKLTLDEFGSYAGEFEIPKKAAVGWYQFRLSSNFAKRNDWDGEQPISWTPIRVLVSDFTPSPFKVTNQINGDLFTAEQEVEVATNAKMHSGGAYTDANLRVTAMLESKMFESKNPIAQDFTFSSYIGDTDQTQVFQKMDKVDGKGENALKFKLPEQNIYYGRLMIESSVQDDRGKYVSAQSYADYAGVDRFVGLRLNDWIFEAGKPANINYIVADPKGNPEKGTKVDILIERQETKAAKVKGAGNAYVTEFNNVWVEANTCSGTSEASASKCEFTAKEPGYYRVTAKIKDTKGKDHSTYVNMYVVGAGNVLWNEANDYSLEIVPEKTTYKVGDKARYLIKNPYPGAKALVSIERYGVLDSFVQTLEGSTPVIEFEVKPDYIPGFYLSVVVTSPRVDKPIENQVDLGKPAFRIGYVTVPIKDEYKEMLVTAKTDREVYKPREKVKLTLHAEPKFKDKSEPVQIAVAVVDESVFDLIAGGKNYYDPYAGFNNLQRLDLRNYSLLTQLVGRQKFEKKGANQGGDGGADLAMRNIFKFVSYWNPAIKPDANGNASVEFEVPDNLTGWRVLAMAVTPTDRMGLGDANFKVNLPTEIRPVMPNQVTEGDSFEAGFSVMNRTDKQREITVNIDATGSIVSDNPSESIEKQITLEPYKRQTIWLPLKAKSVAANRENENGKINFRVTARDASDGDATEHELVVHKRRSLETAANYGTTTQSEVEDSIKFPEKIHTDVGDVSVVASASVIADLEGAFKYVRDYSYISWESILTKGVMASHYKNLRAYLPKDFEWKEAETLTDAMLKDASSFQAPNGGMAYFTPLDNYVDPYLSAYTALAFNWLEKSGYNIPAEVESKLHRYLDNFLKKDIYPDFYDDGLASTVRAVALAALAEHGKITMADLERYRPHVPRMSLLGKNYFVQAAMHVKGAEAYVTDVSKLILASSNQSGGKFSFNETLDDSYSRILSTPLRENCAILSTFTELGEREEGKDLVGDIPFKLVRMITQSRGSRTYWENTQENMFCMNGLIDYARIYENVKPNMDVKVSLNDKQFGETKFADVKDAPVTFTRNIEQGDAGKAAKVKIAKDGDGRLYYSTRVSFAPLSENEKYTNAGIEIMREYSVERDGKWELLTSPAQLKQSELVRVDLFLSLPTARNFVVVDDPIPGGLEPVNRDLATASIVDADKGEFKAAEGSWWLKYSDWISYNYSRWSFYHKELRHDAARFYSDYLPAGNYHLSYTAQAIAPGEFVIMPVKAEEMYDPDVYGKGVAETLKVSQQ